MEWSIKQFGTCFDNDKKNLYKKLIDRKILGKYDRRAQIVNECKQQDKRFKYSSTHWLLCVFNSLCSAAVK